MKLNEKDLERQLDDFYQNMQILKNKKPTIQAQSLITEMEQILTLRDS
jgi:hypothetical protein